ncbi:MAG TPA: replication-associated recombination protein A [Acidimicrobiales bacterium]|nr:replication-associated recombination protein A [Acidimicrobiales bacterium]
MSPGSRRAGPSGEGLFEAGADQALAERGPLAHRMRPRTLDEMVGQAHLVGPGAPLRALIETDRLSSAILWGPPGSGKTTLARLVADTTGREFVPLSAVSAGVADVRKVIDEARRRLGERGQGTILFLDEVHRFNRSQQDALLPSVESGLVTLVGATTENPSFALNAALLSRTTLYRLDPLGPDDIATLVRRAVDGEGAVADDDAVTHLVAVADGDARSALTVLEAALALAAVREGGRGGDGEKAASPVRVTLTDAEAAADRRALRYGPDEHYDVASALIKSIRGSDPDAGLYWMVRMLEAGEDPRFVARRLVILASEDVGMADPVGLLVADAAWRAVEAVGLPEAALNLAHAVVYLATAPKSNRVMAALGRARADVAERPAGRVPAHLRDAHYWSAKGLGHGVGYVYPHDDLRGWVPQEYRPPEVATGTRHAPGYAKPDPYYLPSDHGREGEVWRRLRELWGGGADEPGRGPEKG